MKLAQQTRKHVRQMTLLSRWPAMILTFDKQNLIRSAVGPIEYSLSVLSKLFKAFVRYRNTNICPDEQINERTDKRTNAADR